MKKKPFLIKRQLPNLTRRKGRAPQPGEQAVCWFDFNLKNALVNDTVVDVRGGFADYRPGDIWRLLHGTIFR